MNQAGLLDAPGPALTAATLVLAAVAISFALTTALRHNDVAGRLWSSANVAMLGVCGVAGARAFDVGPTLVLSAAAAGAVVLGTGLLWSGLRAFSGLPTTVAPPLVLAGVVVALRALRLPTADVAEGLGLLAAAVFAGLSVQVLGRGPMARNLHVGVLRVVAVLLTVVLLLAAGLRFAGRAETPGIFVLVAMLVAVAVQCLVAVRVERHGAWWSSDVTAERQTLPVPSRDRFESSARDRLERIGLVGGDAAMVVTGVEDLDVVNDAFGRSVGDDVLVALASVIRSHVPPWAVVGHLGAGTFAVLSPADAPGHGADVAEAIERGLLALRRDDDSAVPIAATSGHADTFGTPMDVNALLEAAQRDRVS